MTKRIIKASPVATSIALTLGLSACGTDNDGNNYVPPVPPVQVETASDDAQFNVEITGKAVKGTMKQAAVSVMTLNEAGETVPVAFRLSASEETETFMAEASSQEAANLAVEASKIAGNPDTVVTNNSGGYSIYLEDDFTGPVYITVKTLAENDDSFLRCDAYLGCGEYSVAPAADEENDGDINIEFGEWYKTDLELSVVKYIEEPEADDSGSDINPERSYTANTTLLTSVVAKLLMSESVSIDEDAIASASLNSVIKVLGPDSAILLAALNTDLSAGGAIDLSDIEGDEELNAAVLIITQLASSVQSLPSITDTINQMVNNVKTESFAAGVNSFGIQTSNSTLNSDSETAADEDLIQIAVNITASIFVAAATGGENDIKAALEAAFIAMNPSASASDIANFASNSALIAKKIKKAKDKGVKNGAATNAALTNLGKTIQKVLSKLGCEGSECIVGTDFFAKLAAELSKQIDMTEMNLTKLQDSVDSAQATLLTVQGLGGDAIEDTDDAITFALAVAELESEAEESRLVSISKALFTKARGYMGGAKLLTSRSSDYSQILDDVKVLRADTKAEAGEVLAFSKALKKLINESKKVISDFNIDVEVAKRIALNAEAKADAKQTLATTAESVSTNALSAAQAAVDSGSLDAVSLAEAAIVAASDFAEAVDQLELAISKALAAAQSYAKKATEGSSEADQAANLIASAIAMRTAAVTQAELADEQFAKALELQTKALLAVATREVKATSESLATMTVLTSTGGDAIVTSADVLSDVIDELASSGNSGTGNSSSQPEWAYDYSLDDLTLKLTNDTTQEMISAIASYQGDKLVVAWGATLKGNNDESVSLITNTNQAEALKECEDFVAGAITNPKDIDSCLSITFDRTVDAGTVDDALITDIKAWNNISIVDGASGFEGRLNVIGNDTTDVATVTLEGSSGDLGFKVVGMVDGSGAEDKSTLEIMVNDDAAMGYTLKMMGTESAGYSGDVKAMYNDKMMSFGTVTKVTNGISISYIDGDTINYTDVTFIDLTK